MKAVSSDSSHNPQDGLLNQFSLHKASSVCFISRLNHCYFERNNYVFKHHDFQMSQIKLILVIFTHLKLWVAAARSQLQVGENLIRKTQEKCSKLSPNYQDI